MSLSSRIAAARGEHVHPSAQYVNGRSVMVPCYRDPVACAASVPSCHAAKCTLPAGHGPLPDGALHELRAPVTSPFTRRALARELPAKGLDR